MFAGVGSKLGGVVLGFPRVSGSWGGRDGIGGGGGGRGRGAGGGGWGGGAGGGGGGGCGGRSGPGGGAGTALFARGGGGGLPCPACGHRGFCALTTRKVFQCNRCKKQLSLTAGTVFQDTKL